MRDINWKKQLQRSVCNIIKAVAERIKSGKVQRYMGLPLVYIGVAVLAVAYLLHPHPYNVFLFAGLVLIVGGTIGQVALWKKEGNA